MTTPPTAPTPVPGDVILVRSPGKESLLNCIGQSLADPYASLGTPMFSHAALVLDEDFVVEAYTSPEDGEVSWSGAPLGEGVRLRLLPDLLIPAVNTVVWRAPAPPAMPNDLDTNSDLMLALIGSEYSIRRLRAAIESRSILGAVIDRVASGRLDEWTSRPDDLGTKMGLDDQFRAEVSSLLPGLALPPQAQDFFCSDLVSKLLIRANLLPANGPGVITPTGLHRYLPTQGWSDVTDSCYRDAERYYAQILKASWSAQYQDRMAIITIARQQRALTAAAGAIAGMLGKLDESIEKVTAKIP